MKTCPGNHKENSKEIFLYSVSCLLFHIACIKVCAFTWNICEICWWISVQKTICVSFSAPSVYFWFISSGTSLGHLLHLHVAHLLVPFGYWALRTVSGILLLLQGWNILLCQSASQSDNAITCLVPALLSLTDEVVIGCCLIFSNHILPVRNRKESSHLAISEIALLTRILMVLKGSGI